MDTSTQPTVPSYQRSFASAEGRAAEHQVPPIFCDLDGSLVATDTLWESVLLHVRDRPFGAWRLALWTLQGRSRLKDELGAGWVPNASRLPYRNEVIELLIRAKADGRRVVLATAAHVRIAAAVANHLGIFDDVLSSSREHNLKGREKLAAIRRCTGGGAFGYVGDSQADVPIWREATEVYVVGRPAFSRRITRMFTSAHKFIPTSTTTASAALRAMRPTQWVKNLLLLVPLLTSHRVSDWNVVLHGFVGIIVFSLCASGVYIFNDLLDIESDRTHARKRLRPFASGELPIPIGLALATGILVLVTSVAAITMPLSFLLLLLAYMGLTSAYSLFFKRRLLQDVFILAGLYTLRIFAGGAAIGVPVSQWLLAFSMFCFLSLALLKRYSEMLVVEERHERQAAGRSYIIDDLQMLASAGPAAGYAAVMVYCLYINSDMVRSLYHRPDLLWFGAPVLLYWFTRMWFLARRGLVTDDPILFAVYDRVSWATALVLVIAAIAASI